MFFLLLLLGTVLEVSQPVFCAEKGHTESQASYDYNQVIIINHRKRRLEIRQSEGRASIITISNLKGKVLYRTKSLEWVDAIRIIQCDGNDLVAVHFGINNACLIDFSQAHPLQVVSSYFPTSGIPFYTDNTSDSQRVSASGFLIKYDPSIISHSTIWKFPFVYIETRPVIWTVNETAPQAGSVIHVTKVLGEWASTEENDIVPDA